MREELMTEPLFPEPKRVELRVGMRVWVQTIWGYEEGRVIRVVKSSTYPMVRVAMLKGDCITMDVARVKPL